MLNTSLFHLMSCDGWMLVLLLQAGGKATSGTERMLDVIPANIHGRKPIFLGCTRDIDLMLAEIQAFAL